MASQESGSIATSTLIAIVSTLVTSRRLPPSQAPHLRELATSGEISFSLRASILPPKSPGRQTLVSQTFPGVYLTSKLPGTEPTNVLIV